MIKKSINELILSNLIVERELAYAKRSANINADLPTDKLDDRITVLNVAIEEHHKMILSDAKKDI